MQFGRLGFGSGALVVLGCAVRLDGAGRLREGALLRRVRKAAEAYRLEGRREGVVVASGGRRWGDDVEADVMARELVRRGVPPSAIVRERLSMSTRENAAFVAESLHRRGIRAATVVTSEWHLPRALMLFRRAGLDAEGVPVVDPEGRWQRRVWRWGKERALQCVQG